MYCKDGDVWHHRFDTEKGCLVDACFVNNNVKVDEMYMTCENVPCVTVLQQLNKQGIW